MGRRSTDTMVIVPYGHRTIDHIGSKGDALVDLSGTINTVFIRYLGLIQV